MTVSETLNPQHEDALNQAFTQLSVKDQSLSVTAAASMLASLDAAKGIPTYRIRDLLSALHTSYVSEEQLRTVLRQILDIKEREATRFTPVKKQEVAGIKVTGGTSNASVSGTVHSYTADEKAAFCDWINWTLSKDQDLKDLLPLNEESDDLFTKIGSGVLLCKLINDAVPETIDIRAINLKANHPVQRHENLTLMLNSARAIGCHLVNIGCEDVLQGIPHLCLGLIWQIVKIGLFARINVQKCPGLARLCEPGESLEDLLALPVETILLRWVNYHVAASGHSRRIANFGGDIKDSVAYAMLLSQIAPNRNEAEVRALNSIETENDMMTRAQRVLNVADSIAGRRFVRAKDIVHGNAKLNLAFVAHLFNTYPRLEPMEVVTIEETREEKTYRNWMNSLGVQPFVQYLYQDLRDGVIFLDLYAKMDPTLVDQKRVQRPPFTRMGAHMRRLENCNYAVELGNKASFSLVGIDGKNLFDGHRLSTLALIWQLMRGYTLAMLSRLPSSNGSRIQDAEIIAWTNEKLNAAGKPQSSEIASFRDSHIATSEPLLDLIDAIKPSSVNYSLVIRNASSHEDRLANAKYAISMARKIGAGVFALPEDVVELKHKMIMTIYACLMGSALQ